MSIKVIREGSPPKVKCRYCNTLFSFEKTDTIATHFGENIRKLICPTCGFVLYVDLTRIKPE